ncbi:MAG: helix-turn-helix domain-containing protein [Desulfomonilaceae bacterium]
MTKLLTFGDLCRLTGVKPGAMRKWVDNDVGPVSHWTPGGKRRFLEEDVMNWIQSLPTQRPNQNTKGDS